MPEEPFIQVTYVTSSIAVVIPAYKQPRLLAEALHSLERSTSWHDVVAVIVNDGCPFDETRDISLMWQRNYPARIFYLEVLNRGLSAARNLGIDFALAALPTVRFVYFLDADNRVGAATISKLRSALEAAPPAVGWAYADLEKFGVKEITGNGGMYQPLEHLRINICDAGSLVRRSLIEAGLRFDTGIPGGGYEDWLFWLEALQRGYSGVHVPFAGFAYRKRPHSMVADADQTRGEKLRYFRSKLPALYSRANINWLDGQQNNILAVIGSDLRGVYLGTGRSTRKEEWLSDLLRSECDIGHSSGPRYILSVRRAEVTDDAELVDLAWQLRLMLGEGERVHWAFLNADEFAGIASVGPKGLASSLGKADAWMASVETIVSHCMGWAPQRYNVSSQLTIHGDGSSRAANMEHSILGTISSALHAVPIAGFDAILPSSHRRGGRGRKRGAAVLLDHEELFPVYPTFAGQRLVAVLASPVSTFTDVLATCSQLEERSAARVAVFTTDLEIRQELALLGLNPIYSLEHVLTLDNDDRRQWLSNTLVRFDEVIDHTSDRRVFSAYSDLKNAGARIIMHVAETTDLVSAVLNESSVASYVASSNSIRDRLLALGAPAPKVDLLNG